MVLSIISQHTYYCAYCCRVVYLLKKNIDTISKLYNYHNTAERRIECIIRTKSHKFTNMVKKNNAITTLQLCSLALLHITHIYFR